MYVLGSPHIKGQSEEILCKSIKTSFDENDIVSGTFASMDANGKLVKYDKALKNVYGVVSQVLASQSADVCKRGYKVPCILKEGENPTPGQPAFVTDKGLVATSGDYQIGTFYNESIITAYDATKGVSVSNCAFIDVAINTIEITGSSEETKTALKQQNTKNGGNQ